MFIDFLSSRGMSNGRRLETPKAPSLLKTHFIRNRPIDERNRPIDGQVQAQYNKTKKGKGGRATKKRSKTTTTDKTKKEVFTGL